MAPSPLQWALSYIGRAWAPIPIPYCEKQPAKDLTDWQNLILTAETAPRYFNTEPQNIGVLLGRASGGLVDVDLDCAEAIALAEAFLPHTPAVFGRAATQRSHRLYVSNLYETEDQAAVRLLEPRQEGGSAATIAELRTGGGGKGAQTIFPGSTHKGTGEAILWALEGDPVQVHGAELKRAFYR